MMIPLHGGPRHYPGWPWATMLITAANLAVFGGEVWLWQAGGELALSRFFYDWGFSPARVLNDGGRALTALTSAYIHGDPAHIFFNLVFFLAFAPRVEDLTGSRRFLLFYTLAGLGGDLLTLLLEPARRGPGIGASGAIAGVMGAFLLLFPEERVRTLVFIGLPLFPRLPAWILLGAWVIQDAMAGQAILNLGYNNTGVGVWAHLGGFAGGLALITLFLRPEVLFNRPGAA